MLRSSAIPQCTRLFECIFHFSHSFLFRLALDFFTSLPKRAQVPAVLRCHFHVRGIVFLLAPHSDAFPLFTYSPSSVSVIWMYQQCFPESFFSVCLLQSAVARICSRYIASFECSFLKVSLCSILPGAIFSH